MKSNSDQKNAEVGLRSGFSYGQGLEKVRLNRRLGFAQFDDGGLANVAVHKTCFACHRAVQARDFVFTRYAP